VEQDNKAVSRTAYIDDAIAAWIAEKRSLSNSEETAHKYEETITYFRAWLSAKQRDLDLELWIEDSKNAKEWRRAGAMLAAEAQQFAAHSRRGKKAVADATYKQRMVILRSFYAFAIGGFFEDYPHPLKKVKMPHIPLYSSVQALPAAIIAEGMSRFDRSTKPGRRNFAMWALYLETGCRLNEGRCLQWKHVELLGSLEDLVAAQEVRLAINFPRLKGGKKARRILSVEASLALLECMASCYEVKNVLHLDPERWLWVSFSRSVPAGSSLSENGVRKLCLQAFGTTEVHRLRHTFAQELDNSGMSASGIGKLMNHNSLATTTAYLDAMNSGENSALAHLDQVFCIGRYRHA